MRFERHFELEGQHAFMGASKFHWINYTEEKILRIYDNRFAAADGVRKHDFAKEAILMGIRMPRNSQTLNAYINDAIGFKMTPEVVLKYSNRAFGTADAIRFSKRILRIHDLKTGVHETSFDQLRIYAAYFCLEYKVDPFQIESILRIYQNDEVREEVADPNEIYRIMEVAKRFDHIIEEREELLLNG